MAGAIAPEIIEAAPRAGKASEATRLTLFAP
jgi:hypothetical protein